MWSQLGETKKIGSTNWETGVSTIEAVFLGGTNIDFTGDIELEGDIDALGRHGTIDPSTDILWNVFGNTVTKHSLTDGSIVEALDLLNAPSVQRGRPYSGIHALAFAPVPVPVPVPAAFWLLASGLLSLVRFGKNSKLS